MLAPRDFQPFHPEKNTVISIIYNSWRITPMFGASVAKRKLFSIWKPQLWIMTSCTTSITVSRKSWVKKQHLSQFYLCFSLRVIIWNRYLRQQANICLGIKWCTENVKQEKTYYKAKCKFSEYMHFSFFLPFYKTQAQLLSVNVFSLGKGIY